MSCRSYYPHCYQNVVAQILSNAHTNYCYLQIAVAEVKQISLAKPRLILDLKTILGVLQVRSFLMRKDQSENATCSFI